MSSTLLLTVLALAAPPSEPEEYEPADKAFSVPVVATSETGRRIIQGTLVDIVLVEGLRTGQHTATTIVSEVPVSLVQRSQVETTTLGRPISNIWIKVSASQQAALDLASQRGKLIVKLHPLTREREPEFKYKALLRRR